MTILLPGQSPFKAEELYHEDAAIAAPAVRHAIQAAQKKYGLLPHGSVFHTGHSLLPRESSEQLKERIPNTRGAFRGDYFDLMKFAGGKESSSLARQILAPIVDGKEIDRENSRDAVQSIFVLAHVGGKRAFNMLQNLSSHLILGDAARAAMEFLYVDGLPDYDGRGETKTNSLVRQGRINRFREIYLS